MDSKQNSCHASGPEQASCLVADDLSVWTHSWVSLEEDQPLSQSAEGWLLTAASAQRFDVTSPFSPWTTLKKENNSKF